MISRAACDGVCRRLDDPGVTLRADPHQAWTDVALRVDDEAVLLHSASPGWAPPAPWDE